MSPLRYLFPSFERPVARQRFIKLEPPRRGLGGVGIVLAVSAVCGAILLALPEASQLPKAPPQFSLATPAKTQVAAPQAAVPVNQTIAASADGEKPSAKLSVLCSDKPTARRACAQAKAAKEALLSGTLARADAKATAQRPTASGPRQKAKTPRVPGAAPVYRRSNGDLEIGAVADGEYRQSRSAELEPSRIRSFFGLQ